MCILARGGHRGIHPGACVAVDLLLWLALAPGTVILFLFGITTTVVANVSDYRDSPDLYGDTMLGGLQDALTRGQALVGLGAALTYVLNLPIPICASGWTRLGGCRFVHDLCSSDAGADSEDGRILHFVTFVIACVETSHRNRTPPQVVFVQPGRHHLQPAMYGQPVLYHSTVPQPQWNYHQPVPMYAPPPQGQRQVYYSAGKT